MVVFDGPSARVVIERSVPDPPRAADESSDAPEPGLAIVVDLPLTSTATS